MAPTIPFWLGEAPGRSNELSKSVSRLREGAAARLRRDPSTEKQLPLADGWTHDASSSAKQLVKYLAAGHAALGCLPTQDNIVFQRFFDEAGGMQLVLHSPYGSGDDSSVGDRRFANAFAGPNFSSKQPQPEDNIVVYRSAQAHSFRWGVVRALHSARYGQCFLSFCSTPQCSRSLALGNRRRARSTALSRRQKVPPQLARIGTEDLIGAVFPDQIACGRYPRSSAKSLIITLSTKLSADSLHRRS